MIQLDLSQKKQFTVAIVIAYFNGSETIERALKSVFSQSKLPDEVIVVNDGSADSETHFLNNLNIQYNIKIISQANGGQGAARNTGVQAASSSFISFLDQDDFYLPGHIEILLNALPQKDLRFGFVYGDVSVANEQGHILSRGLTYLHEPHPKLSAIECIKKDMFILPSAILISKDAFLEVNGFDPQFRGYEDDDLFLRMFLKGFSSYFIKEPVTVWCINTKSTSFSIHMLRSRHRFLKKILNYFPDDPPRGQFYFADYMIPRFGGLFISDALNACLRNCQYQNEINGFLIFYCKLVYHNRYVSNSKKIKTFLATFIITKTPSIFIRFFYQILKFSLFSYIFSKLIRRKKNQVPLASALIRRETMAKQTSM